jgi:hypothetical protein
METLLYIYIISWVILLAVGKQDKDMGCSPLSLQDKIGCTILAPILVIILLLD